MMNGTLRAWYQASRAPFFVATLIPLALGGAVAQTQGSWNTFRWLVVLFASFLVHLATNLANDYFEYVSGADSGEAIGGSRVIQEGKITPQQIFNVLVLCYGIALFCGVWLMWASRLWWMVLLMAFCFFSSLFYTAPPVRYGYRGLGEIFVGLNMGPMMVVGSAAVLAGGFVPRALWLSFPIGLMVALILYYQSLSDIEEDRLVGKRTLAVRLGKAGALRGFRFFIGSTLGCMVLLVATGLLDRVALLSLVTLIPAWSIDRTIRKTANWKDLHDRGGKVRLFYLANGLIMVVSVALCR